jgi:hypothetical protein
MDDERSPLPASISQVLLILANRESYYVYIDTTLKGSELKELIYAKISHTLTAKQMILELHEKRIKDDDIMEKLLTLKDVITQKKIPLNEVSNIEFISNIED